MRSSAVGIAAAAQGPFISVYIADPHGHDGDAATRACNARKVIHELERRGAAPADTALIAKSLREPVHSGDHESRALIASRGTVHIDRPLPIPVDCPSVRFSPLPYLLPLLCHAEHEDGHIVVLDDDDAVSIIVTPPAGHEPGTA
ncbi:hypothetical protein [Tomitella gaofuii]|uniref:hypothetical protein n=1 Tax=Tomitella gaofuii TaxID=2760083 RepID=UPI0015FACE54|nr:hypothetical protein [Tomitella gaofuii]